MVGFFGERGYVMPLPNDLNVIIVTGTWQTITGTALTGQVIFTPSTTVADSTGHVILPQAGYAAVLNASGQISVTIPCTDNANLQPTGWTYTVQEQIPYAGTTWRTYSISLPHTLGSTVDLSAVAPP
jgi:hypothetical protein